MNLRQFFRLKPIEAAINEAEENPEGLKRVLGSFDLVMLGIGAIVGAGIFASIGTAVAGDTPDAAGHITRLGAGPGIIISLILTAIACAFCGLCYAEFASLVPISGSAYTYAYSTLGEIIAWIIGWDLILEYAVGNIAVAVSWSGYFCDLVNNIHIGSWQMHFPKYLAVDLQTALHTPEIMEAAPRIFGIPLIINLPAFFIVALITVILVIGIKESAWFNNIIVVFKLIILAFFMIIGAFYIKPENWHPFCPNGWAGIQSGAAVMFFAYIGFDAVSTAAGECKRPQRDMPVGILVSLGICTLIYMGVALILTGMVPTAKLLGVSEPLALAMRVVNLDWAAGVIALTSVIAMSAVLLVYQLGQPRILYCMAKDGLLPKSFAKIHPRFKTPHTGTVLTGLFVAIGSAFSSLEAMADLCSIGTLSAFILVCLGVIVLRKREPDRPRPFKTPWVPVVPTLGILACLWLMWGLSWAAWIRFAVWLVIGIAFYGIYGFTRSRLRDA